MVLVRRRRSFKTIRRWTKATIRFWTNWWTGISIWTLAFVVARFFGPLASLGVAFWLCCEAVNYVVFYVVFAPRLIRFSAADARDLSRGAVSEASFAAAVDHVCFLIEKDPGRFWQRVTGIADIDSVPVATALSFVKSLLFVFAVVVVTTHQTAIVKRGVLILLWEVNVLYNIYRHFLAFH